MPHFKFVQFNSDGGREYFLASYPEDSESFYAVHYNADGPAIIQADGTQIYFMNGHKGRNDGPTVIHPNGYEEYWTNGELGRKDGPAIIYPDGGKDWIWQGVYHRKDGPAREFADGTKQYFYQGKQINAFSDKEFIRKVKLINLY